MGGPGSGPRPLLSTDREAEFTEDWEAGVLVRVMATKFYLSEPAVTRTAERLGLELRSPSARRRQRAEAGASMALDGGRWERRGRVQVWVPDKSA